MRYFFHIAYHGTKYSGWQKHGDIVSVQQILETNLSALLKDDVKINGCGRTDSKVHASQYFFHADIDKEWDFDLFFRLNKNLPDDIAVYDIIPMQGLPHARFDAIQRSYDYFIHTYKDPFLSGYSSLYLGLAPNFDKMKQAVALLTRYDDQRCFCKTPDRNKHTLCHISYARLLTDGTGDRVRFQISANRFLGKMVRIIMGRLLEIGTGKMSVDEFEYHLISKETPKIIIPAHPQGLYLSKVTYPYLDIPPRTSFSAVLQNAFDTDWQAI